MKHEPDGERREHQEPQAKIENEPRVSPPLRVNEATLTGSRLQPDPISDVNVLPVGLSG
jgi:hypothetical protein